MNKDMERADIFYVSKNGISCYLELYMDHIILKYSFKSSYDFNKYYLIIILILLK